MEPRIVQLEKLILVGRPYYGDANEHKFAKAWERFGNLEKEVSHRLNPMVGFGVEIYGPEFQTEHQWTYFPSVQVSQFDDVPALLFAKTLPSATYAVFTAKGGIPKLGDTFMYAYMTWLPTSAYEVAFPFDFEYYDERFKDNDPDSEVDIYIPVKPKAT